MPISAQELRAKLAAGRKQSLAEAPEPASQAPPESPEEASDIARKRVGSAEQYQDGENKKEGTVTPAHKTRDEIIAANPIVEFLRSRGHKLLESGENFVTNACPVTSHKKPGHCPVSIDVAKQVWYCNDCKVGGSVIDWEAHEKKISAAEVMRELGGGSNDEKPHKEFVCAYDYTDESGKQLFQVVRYKVPPPKNKDFCQRHAGNSGWIWNMKGVRRVLYHLPQVIAAETVIVVEGEKDADKLLSLGFVVTTNVGGAEKWRPEYSEVLRGKDVIIIGDNDDIGRAHVAKLITSLSGIARSLKHAPVPDKFKDVSGFIGLKLPKMALQAINKLIGDAPLIDQVDLHGGASAQSEPRKKNDEDALPAPTSIIALAEMDPAIFEKDNVLGNRFLCIEGTMLVIGQSDIGKSSLSMQQDICFALGRSAFGIKPRRPLRILTIQAENDDGDLAEMARGVCDHLGLSAEEKGQVDRNVIYIKEKSKTGVEFLRQLQRLVWKHKPDIIRIDPLHAYTGGDVRDPKVTTLFLRNGLNPILEKSRCAAIICHHTPKTTNRDTTKWTQSDWMYAAAGNADITNWARAIMVVDSTKVHGVFQFRAAKRGSRIGWADEGGRRIYDRYFCHHSGDVIFWRDATQEDMECVAEAKEKKGEQLMSKEEFKGLVPLDEPIPKVALLERANRLGCGINRAKLLLAALLAEGELFEWRKSRAKARPEVLIARREEIDMSVARQKSKPCSQPPT